MEIVLLIAVLLGVYGAWGPKVMLAVIVVPALLFAVSVVVVMSWPRPFSVKYDDDWKVVEPKACHKPFDPDAYLAGRC